MSLTLLYKYSKIVSKENSYSKDWESLQALVTTLSSMLHERTHNLSEIDNLIQNVPALMAPKLENCMSIFTKSSQTKLNFIEFIVKLRELKICSDEFISANKNMSKFSTFLEDLITFSQGRDSGF
jgi:hypothetical protein